MLLASIHKDHANISRLLNLLTNKLAAIRAEKTVNYNLVKDVVDYLQSYAEKYHHPKEDLIYHYYLTHYSDQGQIASLEAEHAALSALTRDFSTTVEMILMDAVIPQDVFAEKLNTFVDRQREHLELEEREILPQIKSVFTDRDWEIVLEQWPGEDSDPLFGDEVAARYRELAARIS